MINVNSGQLQGDANLVTIGGTVVVIDAGYYTEAKSSVLPYFRNLGIQKIDHFFVSHPHKDHYEGLVALLEDGVQVRHLYIRVPPRHICDREIPCRRCRGRLPCIRNGTKVAHKARPNHACTSVSCIRYYRLSNP